MSAKVHSRKLRASERIREGRSCYAPAPAIYGVASYLRPVLKCQILSILISLP